MKVYAPIMICAVSKVKQKHLIPETEKAPRFLPTLFPDGPFHIG